MKTIASLLIGCIWMSAALAMEPREFETVVAQLQDQKLDEVKAFLDANGSRLAQDADYYAILLNYTLKKADVSVMMVARGEAQAGDLEIRDEKTGEPIGFMGARGGYDEEMMLAAIKRTRDALPNFEDRLDLRLAMAYMAEKIKRWSVVSDVLADAIDVSVKRKHQWTFGANRKASRPLKELLLEETEGRVYTLFYAETDEADRALLRLSKKLIEVFPESIYGYANLGSFHLAKGHLDDAEKYYKQALAIDPKDEIVRSNLEELKKKRAKK